MSKKVSRPPGSVRKSAPPSKRESAPPASLQQSDPIGAALRAAVDDPGSDALWDAAEELASAQQRPDDVAAVYLHVLKKELAPELADQLGQRAARFHDEWFEDPGPLIDALSRVVDRAPDAAWAFERLVLLYTGAARWDDLLALYDRALAQEPPAARKIQLLDEASHVAKDFAGQADRSIHYLQLLLPLKPNDMRLASSLERLFERQHRHRDLIDLWMTRLPTLPRGGALALRSKIARAWLEQLEQPAEALSVIEGLLKDDPHDVAPCKLLEQIVTMTSSSPEVRRRALQLLKERYNTAKRTDDVVRVLRIALGSPELGEPVVLHREIAQRWMELGKDEAALGHWGSVVAIDPGDLDARAKLRELAEKTGQHGQLADALVTAADACSDPARRIELLVEAGHVRCDVLLDAKGAIVLYARVMAAPEVDAPTLLDVARRSSALLQQEQRKEEQLEVLERLSAIEPEAADRRAALGRAAHLAEALGDADRALSAWQRRLSDDARDLEALDATIDLLAKLSRWTAMIAALRARVAATEDPARRRTDLVRIARIHAERLQAVPEAIEVWTEVASTFGEDAETVDALAALFTSAARWQALAELLDGAARRETDAPTRAVLLHRLGDVHRTQLDAPLRGAECYRDALVADCRDEGARAGLTALLRAGGAGRVLALAAETLAKAYTETDDWTLLLSIAEHRLAEAGSDEAKTAILLEAARIQEERAGEPAAALGAVRRAFALAPADRVIEREVHRLAAATQNWNVAVDAYRDAIAAADAERAAELRTAQGALLEGEVGDLAGALEAYLPVLAAHPKTLEAADAVVRVAAQIGRWDAVAEALVTSARAREEVDGALVVRAEQNAEQSGAFDGLTRAMADAVVRAKELPPVVARDLETHLAVWHRDRRRDADAAEAALLRAVEHDAAHEPTLRMLADLQRRAPGRPLLETLLRLADASDDDLGVLCEAAAIALDVLQDRGRSPAILTRLLENAQKRWDSPHSRPTLPPQSTADGHQVEDIGRSPESLATWALERLVGLHVERGDFKAAVDALVGGSALPFVPAVARNLRHRAAEIAAGDLHDEARAIDLYRQILSEAQDDGVAIARLAELYESTRRFDDLIELRRHELGLSPDLPRRLEIRLDVARVVGLAGGSSDTRLEALKENLDEEAGHAASIEALIAIHEGDAAWGPLANTLSEQALRLETAADGSARAAELWARVARIAEEKLSDLDRALSSLGRVVALSPTLEALDALARIHIARGEHEPAVQWVEKRLSRTQAGARVPTVLLLADEHIATGHRDRALHTLQAELDDDAGAGEIRSRLAALYREGQAWEPLARLLNEGSAHVTTPAERLACLREAAEIYQRHLSASHIAIPLLEDAVALAPNDRSVRTALADALRTAGRLDEARSMLESLVEEYGRRRPPERATVHLSLAQIAQARGDTADALAQLELASAMDMQNVEIFRMLGATAREVGELARAERAYRTLLLIVRRPGGHATSGSFSPERRKSNGDGGRPIAAPANDLGPSEVLFELYRIATDLGQPDRAQENLESAFEAATQNELESRRFTQLLRRTKNDELLLRALRTSLGIVSDPSLAASVLAEISEVSASLGRVDDALDASLQALAQSPDSAALHDATFALAARAGRLERYASCVSDLGEQAQMRGDGAQAGALFLRLGALFEESDAKRAAEVYARAESTGVQSLAAWRALDRVYGILGDPVNQARVLRQIVQVESDDLDAASKTEALYRFAAIALSREEMRDEGVDMLTWAIDLDPQLDRAAGMLRAVPSDSPSEPRVVSLYERVARASGEASIILDALERTAALPDAGNDVLREAVELARQAEDGERVEKLLRRAIELARGREVLGEAVWALTALAERRKAMDDVREAIACLRDASEAADSSEAMTLGLEAAALAAGPGGDLQVAAEIYERLRANDASDRNIWKPLLDVYRQMGNRTELEAVIAATVDNVFDPQDRNQLRLERARLMLDDGGREAEAVTVLREILDEEPDQREAATVLCDVLERTGRQDELVELLRRLDEGARDRGDLPMVATTSLRIGKLLEAGRRAEAMDVYGSASQLVSAPDNKPLLQALVRLYKNDDDPADRADTMERLLVQEEGDAASAMALDLAKLRDSLHDDEGVLRALETGFKLAPQSEKLRLRLEKWLNEKADWPRLAEMLTVDAAARKDKRQAVARYREAAKVHREHLGDHAAEAAALRSARALSPDDVALLTEVAHALAAAGQHAEAIADMDHFLAQGTGPGSQAAVRSTGTRATVLRLRAELRAPIGDDEGAIADLEDAYALAGASVAGELSAALDRLRTIAQSKGELETEKRTTMRLLEVLSASGERAGAHDILLDWVTRHEDDRESLEKLAEMDSADGRWDGVVEAYKRLMALDEGEAQVASALKLADACDAAGRSGEARDGLERAFKTAPGNDALRARLRKAYEAAEAWAELASLTLADAQHAPDDASRFEKYLLAGDLRLRIIGEEWGAVEPLEAALKLKPGHHDGTVLLADAYTAAGMVDEAVSLLDKAIAAHKGRRSRELASLMHRMARAANAGGGHDVELAWLQKALDVDMQNGHVAAELAELAIELQQYEIALKALKAITLLRTPGPMSRAMASLLQGRIAHTQGDTKRAVLLAKKALAEDPKLQAAHEFLKEIGAA